MRPWTWQGLAVALLSLGAAGCGGDAPTLEQSIDKSEEQAIAEIGELYRTYTLTKKKPPQSLAELTGFEQMGPNGLQALREGRAIVRLGATLPDTSEEPGQNPSAEVLAWQKQVPEQGGYVLMLDRTVRKMTAEEFQAAPKAGTADATAIPEKKGR